MLAEDSIVTCFTSSHSGQAHDASPPTSICLHAGYAGYNRGNDTWSSVAMLSEPIAGRLSQLSGMVGWNRGGTRTNVACSKAWARAISRASPKRRPMKLRLTGRPKTKPAGTVTSG